MASYNKITLIGHLGDDPATREYEGRKVSNFSLAVNAYTKPGEEPKADWFRVAFWGNNAEVVEKYLKKGNQVHVEGRLSTRTYEDSEGQMRFSLDVQGQNLTMLGSGSNGGNTEQKLAKAEREPAPFTEENKPFDLLSSDDDLPF